MSLTLDGFEVLRAIGTHRDAFADVRDSVLTAAKTILLSQIKAKSFGVVKLQRMHDAIGADSTMLLLDAVADKELLKIAKKIDPHCTAVAEGDSRALRLHLVALAQAKAELSPKPEKIGKKVAKPKAQSKPDDLSWPTSMSAKPLRHAS